MAGIFRDGFDSYNGNGNTVGLAAKYIVSGGPVLDTGRFGTGKCARIGNQNGITAPFDKETSVLSMCCGFKTESPSGNTSPHIMFLNGATRTIGIQFYSGNRIIVWRRNGGGWTQIGQSAESVFRPDIWYTLEIEAVIHDTEGRVCIWLDGNQVLDLRNVDTNNAVGTVNAICMGGVDGGSNTTYFDDVYIIDSDTRLPKAVRIVTLPVNADGSTLEFTPSSGSSHSAVAGEIPASAANYLSATNVGQRDILGLTDLATTPAAIEEVAVVAYMNKTDAPARSMFLGVISGATVSDGAAQNLNASGFRHERGLQVDPNTGAAWTPGGVNALLLQPKVAT